MQFFTFDHLKCSFIHCADIDGLNMFSVFFYVWWKTASIVQFFFHFSSFWLHKCTCSLPSTIQRILEKCFSHTLESKRMKSLIFFLWKMKRKTLDKLCLRNDAQCTIHTLQNLLYSFCVFFSLLFFTFDVLCSRFSPKNYYYFCLSSGK